MTNDHSFQDTSSLSSHFRANKDSVAMLTSAITEKKKKLATKSKRHMYMYFLLKDS